MNVTSREVVPVFAEHIRGGDECHSLYIACIADVLQKRTEGNVGAGLHSALRHEVGQEKKMCQCLHVVQECMLREFVPALVQQCMLREFVHAVVQECMPREFVPAVGQGYPTRLF
jgi:hypothetical protein